MTLYALGNAEEGQQAYQRARERAAWTFPRHPGLLLLQSEAESVTNEAFSGGSP